MLSRNQGHQIIDMTYPSQESIEDSSEKSVLHKIGLIHPYFHGKTRHCKHDFGCLENTLKDTVKSFVYGYGIKMLFSLISTLLRARQSGLSIKRLIETVISQGNLKSGAFFGVMTFLMKSMICVLRKMRKKEDWKNSFLAGALAGYCSLFFVQEKSRVFFTTFFLSRAFDCCYNSLVKRKVIKDSSLNYVYIFMLLNALTVYARFHEPYLVPPSLSHFYEFVYSKGPMEAQLEHVLTTMTQRRLIKKNVMS